MNLSDLVGKAVLSTRSDAIVAADRDGLIVYWNPGAERVFGFTKEEALGQSLDIIIPQRLRARHWDGYARTMKTGQSRYGESDILSVPASRKDDVPISVEFTVVPLKDENGRMTGIAAIIRDVTKRFEEMKRLKRKLAEAAKP